MRKPKFLDEKRTDLLKIDVRSIKPDYEWNPRESYGDIDELAKDILLNGVQIPLKGHRLKNDPNGYQFGIIGGYRRHKACMLLLEKKMIDELRVPLIIEEKGTSEADRLVYTILENNTGKPFNILEISNVIKRLKNYGLDDKEISIRINKPMPFIRNCYALLSAPEKAKNLIRDSKISATLVISIFKDASNINEVIEMLTSMADGTKKITAKKIKAMQGKVNSVNLFKKLSIKADKEGRSVKSDKVELYNYLQRFIQGSISKEELETEFFTE